MDGSLDLLLFIRMFSAYRRMLRFAMFRPKAFRGRFAEFCVFLFEIELVELRSVERRVEIRCFDTAENRRQTRVQATFSVFRRPYNAGARSWLYSL